MDHNGFNVKLVNERREEGGRWSVSPGDIRMITYINQELRAYVCAEPNADWHLETCGTVSSYHRVDGVNGQLPIA